VAAAGVGGSPEPTIGRVDGSLPPVRDGF